MPKSKKGAPMELHWHTDNGEVLVWGLPIRDEETNVFSMIRNLLRSRVCGFLKKNANCQILDGDCDAQNCQIEDKLLVGEMEKKLYSTVIDALTPIERIPQLYFEDQEDAIKKKVLNGSGIKA